MRSSRWPCPSTVLPAGRRCPTGRRAGPRVVRSATSPSPPQGRAGRGGPAPKVIEKGVPPKLADVPGLLKRESLKEGLKSPHADTRRDTVTTLGEAGQRLSESVGDLTDALEDANASVRQAAAEAL